MENRLHLTRQASEGTDIGKGEQLESSFQKFIVFDLFPFLAETSDILGTSREASQNPGQRWSAITPVFTISRAQHQWLPSNYVSFRKTGRFLQVNAGSLTLSLSSPSLPLASLPSYCILYSCISSTLNNDWLKCSINICEWINEWMKGSIM